MIEGAERGRGEIAHTYNKNTHTTRTQGDTRTGTTIRGDTIARTSHPENNENVKINDIIC